MVCKITVKTNGICWFIHTAICSLWFNHSRWLSDAPCPVLTVCLSLCVLWWFVSKYLSTSLCKSAYTFLFDFILCCFNVDSFCADAAIVVGSFLVVCLLRSRLLQFNHIPFSLLFPPFSDVFNYHPAFTTIKIITFRIYMHRLSHPAHSFGFVC